MHDVTSLFYLCSLTECMPLRCSPTHRRYGNNASASFMMAFSEFCDLPPSPVAVGDQGAFVTMGPGAGLESCLWVAGEKLVAAAKRGSATRASMANKRMRDAAVSPSLVVGDTQFVYRVADPPGRSAGAGRDGEQQLW